LRPLRDDEPLDIYDVAHQPSRVALLKNDN